jgi:hypothetical protein
MTDVPPPPDAGSWSSSTPPPPPPPPAVPPPPPNLSPPPGYVGYGDAGSVSPAARTRGLARWIVIMTAVVAVATVVTTILSASISTDAQDFLGGSMSEDDFRDALGPLSTAQVVAGLATLATGILTMIWMYRIASNLRSFGRRTTWHPLFAVFGWFLPPLILYVIPFLMLRELWKASDPGAAEPAGEDRGRGWRAGRESPVLWAWFALFGIIPAVLILTQANSLATDGLPSGDIESVADSLDNFGAGATVVALVNVVAAVTWVLVVRQLTDRHTALTREA